MVGVLSLLGYAAAVAAQFNIKHTEYGTSPPVYPSPQISGVGGWDAALEKAQAFLSQLTTEEKAQMVTGKRFHCSLLVKQLTSRRYRGTMCRQHWSSAKTQL